MSFNWSWSWSSLVNFAAVNTVIWGISEITSWICVDHSLSSYVVAEVVQSVLIVGLLASVTTTKGFISEENESQWNHSTLSNTCIIAGVKGVIHWSVRPGVTPAALASAYSIPHMFLFELVFDFVHYWLHRAAHSNPRLYVWFHKKHHQHVHTCLLSAYHMSAADAVLVYGVPLWVSVWVFGGVSRLQLTHLAFQEFAGHLGKNMAPASSFVQFMWVPKMLGIELYTEDHNLHHTKFIHNYGKRFSLWDRLFGTYVSGRCCAAGISK